MKRLLCLTIASMFFLGCPYYNTFYNAKKAFKEAEKIRLEALKNGSTISPQANVKYDEALEKSALILRDHPTSDLVDDALVLMGDAFVAQQKYPLAVRKYEEILSNYPDSKLVPYAAFAIGKASLSAGDTTQAIESLNQFLLQYRENKWRPDAQMLLGKIAFARGQYEESVNEYTTYLNEFPKHKGHPEAQFYVAESYLELDRHLEALKLFETVGKTAKTRDLEFQANYMVGECLLRDQEYEPALVVFEKLMGRSSYITYRPKIMLAIARCQELLKQTELALENLESITLKYERDRIYDEEVSQAFFDIGQIFEKNGDLENAEQFYNDAKKRSPRTYWVGKEADQKSSDLHQLQKYKEDLIKALERVYPPAMIDSTIVMAEDSTAVLGGDSLSVVNDSTTVTETPTTDVVDDKDFKRLIDARFKLAETYLFQFNLVDSALVQYRLAEEEAGDSEDAAKAAYARAWVMENILADTTVSHAGYQNLLVEYEHSSYASLAAKALALDDPAGPSDKELFNQAHELLFTGQNPDSAIVFYRQVVDKFPDGVYAPRSLYAIGWIAETYQSDPDSALVVYAELSKNYPRSELSDLARNKVRYGEELLAELKAADSLSVDMTDSLLVAGADSLSAGGFDSLLVAGTDSLSVEMDGDMLAASSDSTEHFILTDVNRGSSLLEIDLAEADSDTITNESIAKVEIGDDADNPAVESIEGASSEQVADVLPDKFHGEVTDFQDNQVEIKLYSILPLKIGTMGSLVFPAENNTLPSVRAANIHVVRLNLATSLRTGTNPDANIYLYSEPDGKIQSMLPTGRNFEIIEDRGEWLRIKVDDWDGYVKHAGIKVGKGEDSTVSCQIDESFQPLTLEQSIGAVFFIEEESEISKIDND